MNDYQITAICTGRTPGRGRDKYSTFTRRLSSIALMFCGGIHPDVLHQVRANSLGLVLEYTLFDGAACPHTCTHTRAHIVVKCGQCWHVNTNRVSIRIDASLTRPSGTKKRTTCYSSIVQHCSQSEPDYIKIEK